MRVRDFLGRSSLCVHCVSEGSLVPHMEVTSLEGREVSKGYDKYLGCEFEVLS